MGRGEGASSSILYGQGAKRRQAADQAALTNEVRADHGERIISVTTAVGDDAVGEISDAMADFRHLAAAKDWDFDDLMLRSDDAQADGISPETPSPMTLNWPGIDGIAGARDRDEKGHKGDTVHERRIASSSAALEGIYGQVSEETLLEALTDLRHCATRYSIDWADVEYRSEAYYSSDQFYDEEGLGEDASGQ